MTKCVYIIPCWKNAELSRKAIETALAQPDSAVIAIDNNSDDNEETKNMFKSFTKQEDLVLIENKENLGWIGGINQGIEIVQEQFPKAEYICFMNNDVELQKGFWEKITPHFEREDVGMVGPVANNVSGLHDFNHKGYPDHHEVKFLIGFCVVVRKSIIDKTGGS